VIPSKKYERKHPQIQRTKIPQKGFANANKKHTGIEKEIELNCQIFHTLEERFYTK
jgi:hypothetical protein